MNYLQRYSHVVLSIFVSIVFIQSLYYKFTNAPETIYIFEEKLNVWAGTLGYPGIFAPGGLFSAVHIGSLELLASTLLLVGVLFAMPLVQSLGALVGFFVMAGAISFHLFTPLGVSVRNTDGTYDGGQLFTLACAVLVSCLTILFLHRKIIVSFLYK